MTSERHLIAGPCVYEGYDHACFMLDKILPICVDKRVNLLYKTSFDKANRTSADSFRGAENALKDFVRLRKSLVLRYVRIFMKHHK